MHLDKHQHRLQREQHRQERQAHRMLKQSQSVSEVHCACLIHGNGYSWQYVDVLYNMLCRHFSRTVVLHVYTETSRSVPHPYVKHCLDDWGIVGPKKSWWYKLQLFNSNHYSGPLLYFDLDTVIVNNIDWILQSDPGYFWAIKDFKYLWKPTHQGINSSVMYWDTNKFDYVWQDFKQNQVPQLAQLVRRFPGGDQDYISTAVDQRTRRYFDDLAIKSWRWQCLDGGYDFRRRTWNKPGQGTKIDSASILILHGKPKPDQVQDPVILQHWK